jgi:aspartyl-tRNA(Asn)/glutamyl-tRNA(Gln) amidotransferase subunit B
VRHVGTSELGTKVEIKNMNSLRSLGRAIGYEIARQTAAIELGEPIVQETRHWDEEDGRTHSMRTKEGSSDYRYFPEPDLVPIAPTDEMRVEVRGVMPELPAARRARLLADWGINDVDARVLVAVPPLADYAEAAVAALSSGAPKDIVNWCIGDVLAFVNETGLSPEVLPLAPDGLAELVGLVADGTLSRNQAKDVLDECLREPKRPKQVVDERGLAQVSDEHELTTVVDAVLAENPALVDEFRAAADETRDKKLNALMGMAMRATRGQGNPQLLKSLIEQRLGGN